MRAFLRNLFGAIAAVPLSVCAFVIMCWWLIFREPDDNPYIDGGDDADRD